MNCAEQSALVFVCLYIIQGVMTYAEQSVLGWGQGQGPAEQMTDDDHSQDGADADHIQDDDDNQDNDNDDLITLMAQKL